MAYLRGKITIESIGQSGSHSPGTVTLPFEARRRSRLRTRLDDGREVALLLPRGTLLADGASLLDEETNFVVTVKAAAETLSIARAAERHLLVRAAYHLGNRHVPLQLGPEWLAYQHDHVLDDLVRGLGLTVQIECRPFEPEAGGYGRGHRHDPGTPHHDH